MDDFENNQTMDWLIPQDFLSQVQIRPFKPGDQAAARQLILNGLAEYWGWLDPDKNPDLEDIGSSFADGLFLVGIYRGDIVGTGGLRLDEHQQAEIVRVHVAEHCRRLGLGSRIVTMLCEYARRRGFKEVVLETTETWEEAIAFYTHIGFQVSHHQDGDVHMVKQLEPASHTSSVTA